MLTLLGSTDGLRGLFQGGNCEIPGKDDAEDFRRLLNTMEVLNFSVDEQNSIFRILSSVLHLGNVYFEKYEVLPLWGAKLCSLGTIWDVAKGGSPHPTAWLCPADRLPGGGHGGECHGDPDGG